MRIDGGGTRHLLPSAGVTVSVTSSSHKNRISSHVPCYVRCGSSIENLSACLLCAMRGRCSCSRRSIAVGPLSSPRERQCPIVRAPPHTLWCSNPLRQLATHDLMHSWPLSARCSSVSAQPRSGWTQLMPPLDQRAAAWFQFHLCGSFIRPRSLTSSSASAAEPLARR